jgi:hypothetical protein
MVNKQIKWNVMTTIEKYNNSEDFLSKNVSEIKQIEGNMLLSEGVLDIWRLMSGANNEPSSAPTSIVHYDNLHSYIGVGTSNTAPSAGDGGLLGGVSAGAQFYKEVDSAPTPFPVVSGNKITFKSTFYGEGAPPPYNHPEAVFEWNEWSVARGVDKTTIPSYDYPSPGDPRTDVKKVFGGTDNIDTYIKNNLNRKQEAMGTKASAATWVITVEISLT